MSRCSPLRELPDPFASCPKTLKDYFGTKPESLHKPLMLLAMNKSAQSICDMVATHKNAVLKSATPSVATVPNLDLQGQFKLPGLNTKVSKSEIFGILRSIDRKYFVWLCDSKARVWDISPEIFRRLRKIIGSIFLLMLTANVMVSSNEAGVNEDVLAQPKDTPIALDPKLGGFEITLTQAIGITRATTGMFIF